MTITSTPFMREKPVQVAPGGPMFLAFFAAALLFIAMIAIFHESPGVVVPCILLLVADIVCLTGLFTVSPNEGKVLQLFGRYVGSVREPGWKWASPFYTKRKISLRIRNFESNKLKVNEHDGSPIEIA